LEQKKGEEMWPFKKSEAGQKSQDVEPRPAAPVTPDLKCWKVEWFGPSHTVTKHYFGHEIKNNVIRKYTGGNWDQCYVPYGDSFWCWTWWKEDVVELHGFSTLREVPDDPGLTSGIELP
jgi:hypothetical protein